jgi:hypothetical protein
MSLDPYVEAIFESPFFRRPFWKGPSDDAKVIQVFWVDFDASYLRKY